VIFGASTSLSLAFQVAISVALSQIAYFQAPTSNKFALLAALLGALSMIIAAMNFGAEEIT
jgi:hypothetical protein